MDTITAPFSVVIDKQEKRPVLFQSVYLTHMIKKKPHYVHVIVPTVRKHLITGDYSILGYEDQIAFERKSPQDLQRSITHQRNRGAGKHNRDRFERELERLQHFTWSAVIVEGSWKEFLQYCHHQTDMAPTAAHATIVSYQHRFPRTHWLWIDRQWLSKLMYQHFLRFYEDRETEQYVALG